MPWQEVSTMSLRQEFVMLAMQKEANVRELCRRFGVSPKTGYKWIGRYATRGASGLAEGSRRPRHSPTCTAPALEQAVLELRDAHPCWGARKLRRRLQDQGWCDLPAPSTVQAILGRHGRIDTDQSNQHRPWQRFEHVQPNALWQMDFKGHFAVGAARCHPLTVLDDHSRFNLCLQACVDEQGHTVQTHLTTSFRRYGLPQRVAVDNGSPWGDTLDSPYTPLVAWLIRLGIRVSHSRPYHPQTLGKDERFHRSLKAEVLRESFPDLDTVQTRFDRWRTVYNFERPHEALSMQTPATHYAPSSRAFPETLPPIEYAPGDIVRRVQQKGVVSYRGRSLRISKAFTGYPVALRPTVTDGVFDVFFCHQKIAQIDIAVV
jgi:transposase InsO family protein